MHAGNRAKLRAKQAALRRKYEIDEKGRQAQLAQQHIQEKKEAFDLLTEIDMDDVEYAGIN